MKKIVSLYLLLTLFSINAHAQGSSKTIDIVKETTGPDTVKIGAYVISLHDINFHDKEYTMRFWLWLLHNNKEFDFPYQVEVPNAKSLEKPDMMTDEIDGKIWCLMKMKTIMKQSWNVNDFPFDKQYLHVTVENTVFDVNSLVFKADTEGSNFDSTITVDGWNITNFNVSTGTTHYHTAFGDPSYDEQKSAYSHFEIAMVLERNAWGLFFKLFIGMFIAFLISSVSFVLTPLQIEPKFGLPVGGLFAAVGNKYIIDSLLPETSEFTLVDSLHMLTFLFIFFTVALGAISQILTNKEKHKQAERLNTIGGLVIVSSYFVISILLVVIAIL